MAATIHETLDGLGAWQFGLKTWDDDLADECKKGRILLVSEGERAIAALLILTRSPTEAKPSIGGQFPDWRLGAGDTGPLIEAREYVAGTDKLANGAFSLGDLYYRFGQDTLWIIGDAGPATTTGDRNVDDLLESDETFLTAPGRQYRLTIVSKRNSGTVGRLRGRVLFEGRFAAVDLMTNGNFELGPGHGWGTATKLSIVTDAPHAHSGTKVLKAEPIPQPDALVNGDFEAGDVNWAKASNTLLAPVSQIISDPARARTGDKVLLCGTTRKRGVYGGDFEAWTAGVPDGWHDATADFSQDGYIAQTATNRSGSSAVQFTSDGAPGHRGSVIESISPPENYDAGHPRLTRVLEGERYRFTGFCANDIASPPDDISHTWAEIRMEKEDFTTLDLVQGVFNANTGNFVWRLQLHEFNISPGFTRLGVRLFASNAVGSWYWDDVTLERIEGNEEIITSDPVAVVAGEEWDLTVIARSGPAFLSGGLFPRTRLRGVKTVTTKALTSNVATLTIGTHPYVVGQKIAVAGVDATFDGTYVVTAITATTVSYAKTHADVASTGATGTAGNPDLLTELTPFSQTNGEWVAQSRKGTIPDGYDTAIVELRGRDITGDWIYVDDCTFIRTKGNTETITHDPVTIIPGRSYRLKAQVRSGPAASGGEIALLATLSAPGRDDVNLEIDQGVTDDLYVEQVMAFVPPSGYDTFTLAVRDTDILGDNFWVDDITLIDDEDNKEITDNKTFVRDLVISDTGLGTHTLEVTAPAGAEKVRVQVLVESQGGEWEVDEVHFQRIGVTPATVASIVADLLRHPDTGEQLLELGTVYGGSDVITHDWEFTNLHNLEALVHLLSGGVAPTLREYRVRPAVATDGTVSVVLDVGEPDDLYEHHTANDEMVFTVTDRDMLEPPNVTEDATTYVSHIKVIGAQRQKANGDTITITATAAVPWAVPMLNDDGTPVKRTRVITDSSVNHPLYAQALVDFEAASLAHQQQALTMKVADTRGRGSFDVGDWILPHVREAGIEGDTDHVSQNGTVVFPQELRVIDRQLTLGAGWKAEILVPGGEPIDITHLVLWDPLTTATITIGSLVPSFTTDDQGGAAFQQFRRFLASPAH